MDGVPYICNDTNYNWSSVENYTKLDTLTLPNEGWAKNLQADERFPWLQITKEVGGSSGTYLADYFWINKSGSRIVRRGADSNNGDNAGAFNLNLNNDASLLWCNSSADLSLAAALWAVGDLLHRDRDASALAENWPIRHAE